MLKYVEAFLTNRTLVARVPGATSSPRPVMQGVPQGSVISPLLFNLVMAALPCSLSQQQPFPVHISIYADDVAMWCVGPTRRAKKVCNRLQGALNAISHSIETLGLTLSPEKTAALLYRPKGRAPKKALRLTLTGIPVKRVKTYRYLGLLVDDRVTWRPEVKKVLSKCRSLLGVIRCMREHSWGTPQKALLQLYRGLPYHSSTSLQLNKKRLKHSIE